MIFFYAVATWYLIAGVVTFVVFAVDKRRARLNRWRIRESSLHALALCGGVVGAWVAIYSLRHKSSKLRFKMVLLLVTLVHSGGWGFVIYAR